MQSFAETNRLLTRVGGTVWHTRYTEFYKVTATSRVEYLSVGEELGGGGEGGNAVLKLLLFVRGQRGRGGGMGVDGPIHSKGSLFRDR